MSDERGRFVQGRWVDGEQKAKDPTPPGAAAQDPMEARIAGATELVSRTVHELASLTRDIVASPEGHRYMERVVNETAIGIERALGDLVAKVEEEVRSADQERKGRKTPEEIPIR